MVTVGLVHELNEISHLFVEVIVQMKLVVQQWHLEVVDLLAAKLNARGSFFLAREHAIVLYCTTYTVLQKHVLFPSSGAFTAACHCEDLQTR